MFMYPFPYSRLDAFAHAAPGNRHHKEWGYKINYLCGTVSLARRIS
jgi:hypothetical protein